MAISYVGSATGTTSATLPTFSVGDFALVFAYRDGSTTAPSLPTGWTSALTGGGNTNSAQTGYRVLQSGDTTTGTWTNSTSVVCLVYRAGSGEIISIGASSQTGAASTSINYASLTLNGNGKSWVVGFAGHRRVDTSLETPPTGWSNRASVVDATDEAAGHDTGGPVSSWAGETVSVGGTSSGHRDHVLELSLLSPDDNLLLFPEAFDNAAWATFSAPTVTANVENDPNGNATVDNINLGQDARQHIASLPAGTYTLSAYVKSGPATAATAVRFTTNNTLAWNTGVSQKHSISTTLSLYSTTFTLASTQALAVIIGAVDATGAADGTITGNYRIAWAMLNIGSARGNYVPVDPPAGGAYTLTAAAGAYALTGVAATLQRNKLLTAVSGAYTLSGIAATLRRNKLLSGAAGAYALSGVSATLAKSKALPAATGSYAVGGIAATLAKSRILAAAQGSYVFTGVAATLDYQPLVGYTLAASAGAYTLAGVAALFSRSRILQAAPGAYSLTGVAATLSYQPVSASTLDAAAGAYALNGQNASFDYSGGTISAQVREVEWRFNNPLLQRIKDANARRVKPARKAARKIAVAIEYQAAELALSGGGEDKFRELLRTWTLQKPVINDPGVDIEQLFMAQVALKLESVQNQLIKRAAEDEEDSIIAILLAI